MSIVDQLLAQESAKPLIVIDAAGIRLTFQAPASYPKARRLVQDAKASARVFSSPALLTGELKGWDTEGDEDSAYSAFVIAETSVDPKLSHLDALRLCKQAPNLFSQLVVQVVAPVLGIVPKAEAEAVEEAKKPCGQTPCSGCSCERLETAGDAIPTK